MISADEQSALVDAHNQWRSRFNSPGLVWDGGLATLAQDWADQLAASGQFDHLPNNQFGENIFMGTSGAFPANAVVDDWGSEQANYDIPSLTCAPGAVCGHFTQLVWSKTARVGCGKATAESVNLAEALRCGIYCVASCVSVGGLIQAADGISGGSGGFRTNRSGWAA
jgi:hypothetical protein